MFLKKLRNLRHTLALRLTLWYGGIFAVSSIVAFSIVYGLLAAVVQERTDEELEDDLEEFASMMSTEGLASVREEIAAEVLEEEATNVFFRLWGPDGRELLGPDLSSWPGLAETNEILSKVDSTEEPLLETLDLPGREHGARAVAGRIGPNFVLQFGQSTEDDEELMAAFRNGFLITLAAVVLLGGPIGWFMARRALRGVDEVTRTANEIAAGALDKRVAVGSQGDEIDRLAQAFNTMIDRIQALIVGMREMTDNLAHDLRSPLARIRASAEMAMINGNPGTQDEATLAANTTEECDRLLEIVNATLDIAEAESGAARLNIADIDLAEIVRDACELFQTIAEDRKITLAADLPEHCRIRGDRQKLQRVVANLLDNALKYTPVGGQVTARILDEGAQIRLSIEDTGVGISPEEKTRIFERFYRCDPSRSEQGNGLGLSLALAFARAQGGSISVQSAPGEGSTFTLAIPRLQRSG